VYIQRDRLDIINNLKINFPSKLIALSQKARVRHYETKLFKLNNHIEERVSNDYNCYILLLYEILMTIDNFHSRQFHWLFFIIFNESSVAMTYYSEREIQSHKKKFYLLVLRTRHLYTGY